MDKTEDDKSSRHDEVSLDLLSPTSQDINTNECILPSSQQRETEKQEKGHTKVPNRRACLNPPFSVVIDTRRFLDTCIEKHSTVCKTVLKTMFILGYIVYFVYAMVYKFGDEGSKRLLALTGAVFIGYVYYQVSSVFGARFRQRCHHMRVFQFIKHHAAKKRQLIERCISVGIGLSLIIFIVVDVVIQQPRTLISAAGLFTIVFFAYFFSNDPSQVKWRTVLWGLFLQLIFAIIVLRTSWGYYSFKWLGSRVTEFLAHADEGSSFAFGKNFREHFFAFQVMSVIVFFSSIISILYYLGWLQFLIKKVAVIMQYSLHTSAMESLHAALNIFLGWGETLTFLRPLLDQMTLSEIHTVMTNGLATVAGSTLAVYTLYGIPANHLISASVMSAPAALAVSKLFFPEDQKKKSTQKLQILGTGWNMVDAAAVGAVGATSIVAYILATVIAFFSILGFVNSMLVWCGERIGLALPDYPPLTFQLICSYLFWPLVYLMGVDAVDCLTVARMVGIKTFINEFFAYEDLGNVIKNGEIFNKYNGTWNVTATGDIVLESINTTLIGGVISERSQVISTYALCGFSNVTAIGIMIGAMTAVVPSRREDIVRVSFRALVSACMACFMTACVAGLLTN